MPWLFGLKKRDRSVRARGPSGGQGTGIEEHSRKYFAVGLDQALHRKPAHCPRYAPAQFSIARAFANPSRHCYADEPF